MLDAESGLIYLRARYYDPSTGQFLSRDPMVAMTQEPYSYVGNNPLNETDPSGLLHYTFNFDLGATGQSPDEVFAYWTSHFHQVFPIRGAPDELHLHQKVNLDVYAIPFPLYVAELSSHGFKFTTGWNHPDYPGWITFDLSQSDDCHMHLRIHGYTPDYSAGGLIGKRAYRGVAHHIWGPLSDNLRQYLGN